uniref:Uncharacterized protein TCIL3000_11_3970 n=1 Tax=Trypanosoma congolense (strain IL3000) TaxID=1068625 RepID=G0V025_TRYCI|nr:unnamed protein product [Trypanosoma congolense IL3000]
MSGGSLVTLIQDGSLDGYCGSAVVNAQRAGSSAAMWRQGSGEGLVDVVGALGAFGRETYYGGEDEVALGGSDAANRLLCQYNKPKDPSFGYVAVNQRDPSRIKQKRHCHEQDDRSVRYRTEVMPVMAAPPVFKLNIGGTRFHVRRDTFLQFDVTAFHVLCSGQLAVQCDEFGYIYFNRDPGLFRQVLRILEERSQCLLKTRSPDALPQQPELRQSLTQFDNCNASLSMGPERLLGLSSSGHRQVLEEARYYGLNELISELIARPYEWRQCIFEPFSSCTTLDKFINFQHPSAFGQQTVSGNHSGQSENVQYSLPQQCCFASFVNLNNYIYMFGKCKGDNGFMSTIYRLQLESRDAFVDRWQEGEGKDSEEPFGGAVSGKGTTSSLPRVPVIRYELIKPRSETGLRGPQPRTGHAIVSLGGCHVLLFYGNNHVHHIKDVWAYNTIRNTWHEVKLCGVDVPARSGHTVTLVGNYLYLFGGKDFFGQRARYFTEVYHGLFDACHMQLTWTLISSPTWRRHTTPWSHAPAPSQQSPALRAGHSEIEGECDAPAAAYHSAVEYAGRYIVVHGGHRDEEDNVAASAANMAPFLHIFDTLNATWRCLNTYYSDTSTPCWTDLPRNGHVAVRFGNNMFVMGSYSCTRSQQLELFVLSLTTLTWQHVQTRAVASHVVPSARALFSSLLLPPVPDRARPVVLLLDGYDTVDHRYLQDAHVVTL